MEIKVIFEIAYDVLSVCLSLCLFACSLVVLFFSATRHNLKKFLIVYLFIATMLVSWTYICCMIHNLLFH